jgi:aspartate aminotransferase
MAELLGSQSVNRIEAPWYARAGVGLDSASVGADKVCLLDDGELDLPTPSCVIEATRVALALGKTRYDDLKGLCSLRAQICLNLSRYESVEVSTDEVLIANGSSQAIFQLFQCVLSSGDRVLVPSPAWQSYEQGVRSAGGIAVRYACAGSDPDLEELHALVRGGAKMLVINSPHNPTGTVLSRRFMEGVVALAAEHDLILLSDEAYHGLTYQGVESVSARSVRGPSEARIITSRTFSKAYSMAGYRVGYIYGPRDLIDRASSLQAHVSDHVCTFSQYGALAAAQLPASFLSDRSSIVEDRMGVAYEAISSVFPCAMPQGGFYLFPDVRGVLGEQWRSSASIARALKAHCGISVLPGESFGSPGHLRISVALSGRVLIARAMQSMTRYLEGKSSS